MVEFGGFEMPVQYGGIRDEHMAVRSSVGLFDASHMGEIEVTGEDRVDFLQYVLTNDLTRIGPGRVQYSLLCNEQGGVVDDLLVCYRQDSLLLVVNAANTAKDYEWLVARREDYISRHTGCQVELTDRSGQMGLLALQGPRSEQVISDLLGRPLDSFGYYSFVECEMLGHPVILSRTGYTGEDGFEIVHDTRDSVELFRSLLTYRKNGISVTPCGLGARDSLRLEMGYSLYGHELGPEINPYEAGLSWVVRLEKADFVGRDALLAVRSSGPRRRLVGFELSQKGVPRAGADIVVNATPCGTVTSGGFSPVLGRGIGLALVEAGVAKEMTERTSEFVVVQQGRTMKAVSARVPFVPSHVKR